MDIIIEDAKMDFELPNRKISLREVVDEVEAFLFSVGKVPVSLKIDDKELSQADLESRLDKHLSGKETLHFGIREVIDFVIDNLKGSQQANEQMRKMIDTFADEIYSTEKTLNPTTMVMEFNEFFQFWIRLRALIPTEVAATKLGGRTFDEAFEDLRGFLQEIVNAMEGKDYVLAADLLQYEFAPVLEQLQEELPGLVERISAKIDLSDGLYKGNSTPSEETENKEG